MHDETYAPFADAVLRVQSAGRPAADIVSFHALPWSQGQSVRDSGRLRDKYWQIFGPEFLASEMTYSGEVLDTFFYPSGPLELAEQLAAEAFGSTHTFFGTCGTTLSNQVAVDTWDGAGRRFLVDRTAHHSLHVATARARASVEYAPSLDVRHPVRQPLLDVPGMLRQMREAVQAGVPYDTVVLAGSSYDGVLYNVPAILAACREASPETTSFLVDEAWSAINAFHGELRQFSGLSAAANLDIGRERAGILVTQSAHKSMSAARQGSYLHVLGDEQLVASVRTSLYGRHSTSPSIPILASLDLARAHAQAQGERAVRRSIELARYVCETIAVDPKLKAYSTTDPYSATDPGCQGYFAVDPTKVRIDSTGLNLNGEQMRTRLFRDHRIYVSRTLPGGFLLNIHIGTDLQQVDRLLDALRFIARRVNRPVPDCPDHLTEGNVDRLVVAYPPGVPLAVPGEAWTEQHQDRLDTLRGQGGTFYTLPLSPGG
ncbi:hypothetical protein [Longispora albida]|uniref:hypothetical protein n=1 Tax=Longispora albida TaxID=203523 RepID=UPI0003725859|nr:hypothetical protein [Longispora albida]